MVPVPMAISLSGRSPGDDTMNATICSPRQTPSRGTAPGLTRHPSACRLAPSPQMSVPCGSCVGSGPPSDAPCPPPHPRPTSRTSTALGFGARRRPLPRRLRRPARTSERDTRRCQTHGWSGGGGGGRALTRVVARTPYAVTPAR